MPAIRLKRICSVANCENPTVGRGLCRKHYLRQYRRSDGDLSDPKFADGCSVAGCAGKHHSHGLCRDHVRDKLSADPLSLERLKELLHYDAEARVFYWRAGRGKNKAGSVAGSVQVDGYSRIMIDHKGYSVSRLAYFYEHGTWPKTAKDYPVLTQERLKQLLEYDPNSGKFWHRTVKAGSEQTFEAGGLQKQGYRCIKVDGRTYYAQRLAFLYVNGAWPKKHVDHRDMNKDNNAWANLREATRSQNCGNRTAHRNNKLGVKGVHKRGGKYLASINVGHKVKHLGSFSTIEEASAAYANAACKYFGEFARSE